MFDVLFHVGSLMPLARNHLATFANLDLRGHVIGCLFGEQNLIPKGIKLPFL